MQRITGAARSLDGAREGSSLEGGGGIGRGGIAAILILLGLTASACGAGGGGSPSGGDGGGDLGEEHDYGFDDYAIQFGMNSGVQNWTDRAVVFADAMMRGMEFGVVENNNLTYNDAPLIPLGENPPRLGEGWPDFGALEPGQAAGSRLMNVMAGGMPDGRVVPYAMTWDGTGSCSLNGPAVVRSQNRTANRVEVFIDPTAAGGNAQLAMFIDESSIIDPVRNVHVWLPGMEDAKPLFWPPFLVRVEAMNHGNGPYSWRAMDWSRVNMYGRGSGNQLFEFDLAGCIFPQSPSQGTRRGMCPEFMVAFCNETHTNLHLNLPHRTDDMSEEDYVTYVTDTLTRVRDGSPAVPGINGGQAFEGLDPDLTVTLELSNEIWNSGFPVYWWMSREATNKGLTFEAQIASQIELVFGIADEVFSGSDAARLRKYIGAFIAGPSYLTGILSNLPPNFEIDAIGPATYFSPSPAVISDWMEGADSGTGACPNCPTVEEIMAAARDRIAELRVLLRIHRSIATNWLNPDGSNAALEIYEGGQSLIPGYQPWWPEANAAQVHPLMYDAYVLDMIPMLVEEGADMILWYSFMTDQEPLGGNGVGAFGIWNDMNQVITYPVPDVYVDEGAPKAAAIYRGPPLLE